MSAFLSSFPFLHGLLFGILAMLIHEAGHMAAAQAIGIRIKSIGLCWKGLYTVRETGSPAKNLLISLAGPLTNVVLLAFWPLSHTFGLANLCFAFFNLIPLRGSDGDRVLSCWKQMQSPAPLAQPIQNRPAA